MTAKPFGRIKAGLALLLIAVFAIGLYLPGLSGPLLLDDYSVVLPLVEVPSAARYSSDYLFSTSGPLGRPITMASFALNASLSGADLRAWKATNLLLHVLCAGLIYLLLVHLLRAVGKTDRARPMALILTAVWLLHPLQVSTVLYLVQRMTQLSALFTLLGLLTYSIGRTRVAHGNGGAGLICLALLVFTPLAALAKEIGLLLPLFIAALEWTVFAHCARPRWLRNLVVVCAAALVSGGLLYFALDIQAHLLNAYIRRDFTLAERLMSEPGIVLTYLRWIIVPRRLDYGFYHDDAEIVGTLINSPLSMAAIALIVGMIVFAVRYRHRLPLAAFGISLFLLGHLLESTVIGLELVAEHRNYLPLLGLCLVLGNVLFAIDAARLRLAVGCSIIALLAVVTLPRTLIWGDPGHLFASFVAARPNSERARLTLSEWHVTQGRLDLALGVLKPAHGLGFDIQRLRIVCAADQVSAPDAKHVFAKVSAEQALSHYSYDALLYLASAHREQQCQLPDAELRQALSRLRSTPTARSKRYQLEILLAKFDHDAGRVDDALSALDIAAQLQARDPFVHYLMAEWLVEAARVSEAHAALNAARARHGATIYPRVDSAIAAMLDERVD